MQSSLRNAYQFSEGFCTESITRTSTVPLELSSLRPSSCSMAVKMDGPDGSDDSGVPPGVPSAVVRLAPCSGLNWKSTSNSPLKLVLSATGRPAQDCNVVKNVDTDTALPHMVMTIPDGPGAPNTLSLPGGNGRHALAPC